MYLGIHTWVENKYVSLKCACNFTISYTYPPLATKPKPQIVAFRIKCVPNRYIGNVIYVKLIYIIAGVTCWYQLCQCINEIVEYKYIFISSLHIFWQLQPIIGIDLYMYGRRVLFTENVLLAKSI